MLTKDQAHEVVQSKVIRALQSRVIMTDATQDHGTVWAVHVVSANYLRTGDPANLEIGGGAILVDKATGEFFHTASAMPTEYYVEVYNACGDPLGAESEFVQLKNSPPTIEKSKLVDALRRAGGFGSAKALETAGRVIDDGLDRVETQSAFYAGELANALTALGIECGQVWLTLAEQDRLILEAFESADEVDIEIDLDEK